MKVIVIKDGGRARELKADVSFGCMGELFITTDKGDGTWGASYLTAEGVTIHSSVLMSSRNNSLSFEFDFAVDNGTEIVLVDSGATLPRALKRSDVDQEKLLVSLLVAVC